MKQKHIDAAREARLWIGQIIVPAVTVVSTMMCVPEVRRAVADKYQKAKDFVQRKFKKS